MSAFQQVIKANETAILSGWLSEMATSTRRTDLMGDTEIRQQATELLRLFNRGLTDEFGCPVGGIRLYEGIFSRM